MARDIPVGNGRLLVTFDRDYQLRDFYFPHVGQENHTGREPFRLGVWSDGTFSWVPHGWDITLDYLDDTMVTDVRLTSSALGLSIGFNDMVDFHENIFLRKLTVENTSDLEKEVRVFFAQDFHIYGNNIGDTALFRPDTGSVVHYKDKRYFLVNIFSDDTYGVRYFATGNKEHAPYRGTWKDAEDGTLGGNPIAQGSVDSVVSIHMRPGPREKAEAYYWICAGKSLAEVTDLNTKVMAKSPACILKRTTDYWKLWADKEHLDFALLPPDVASLYRRSLLVMRTQIDDNGSIIAANDSDVVAFNRDTYSYMWPRDGALSAYALDMAGYPEISRSFFALTERLIERSGFFLHKYNPSGTPASSWHPWLLNGEPQLPIQEDETALVIWALWAHYEKYKDIEFIKPLYRSLIKKAADMMMTFRDPATGLPLPSYDLWEESHGVHTFTVASVYGGLKAAAAFTRAFGEEARADKYEKGARRMREAMDRYLYLDGEGRFARMIRMKDGEVIFVDKTVDASLFGIFAFGAYGAGEEKVVSTMAQVYDKLHLATSSGGLARYENDGYYRVDETITGNPWFITTLWMAWYYIEAAADKAGLEKALELLEWTARRSMPSGVLSEQIDPYTNEPLSVSPLTWSHATYVTVVHKYLLRLQEMESCKSCGRSMI
ncbi:MAG: glycoside hydrolase family 15 protein [Thermodesulfobacteriota bacterium]